MTDNQYKHFILLNRNSSYYLTGAGNTTFTKIFSKFEL